MAQIEIPLYHGELEKNGSVHLGANVEWHA